MSKYDSEELPVGEAYFIHGHQFKIMVDKYSETATFYKNENGSLILVQELKGATAVKQATDALAIAAKMLEEKS